MIIFYVAVDRSTEKSLSDAREAFFNAISDSLSAFKLGCSSYSGSGTMLAPLSLKVFPLYILATLKHVGIFIFINFKQLNKIFQLFYRLHLELINLLDLMNVCLVCVK